MAGTKVANPAPLGLLGFGLTTVLLNIHNAGLMEFNVMILAMGLCYGGTAQIIAGIMEFRNKNVFGATAFTSYGLFWLSLCTIWINPFGSAAANGQAMGWHLLMWGIFTLFMFIGSLKHNRVTQFVFFSLTLLFFLLACGDFIGSKTTITIAGIVGIVCGLSAAYSAFAQILNNEFGKTMLPLCELKDKFIKSGQVRF
ncbi:MAG: acetate uptake transporter [Coriobacteriia bacterium]|nr:acetate uptake transporter [Coriobacteriia bacterium]